MSERTWTYAAVSEIKGEESRYVRIPDRLIYHTNVVKPGFPVLWHYEKTENVLIITRTELEKEEYEYSGESRKFRKGDSEYTLVVPKAFFSDFEGRGKRKLDTRAANKINLDEDGRLHFVYHDEMVENAPRTCYALTDDQFDRRFSDSDQLKPIDDTPGFLPSEYQMLVNELYEED